MMPVPNEARYHALEQALIKEGYLSFDVENAGTAIRQMGFLAPDGVEVFWRAGEDDPDRVAAQAVIDRWPWGAGRDLLEDEVAKAAAKAVLGQSSPVIDMVRVFGRHVWDRLNEIAVHVGLEKKLEPLIFQELDGYVDAGLSLPGLRPDLEQDDNGG